MFVTLRAAVLTGLPAAGQPFIGELPFAMLNHMGQPVIISVQPTDDPGVVVVWYQAFS